MKLRLAALAAATGLLAACASSPKPLQGEFAQVSPQQAAAADRTGAVVRWGGRVVEVEPGENRTCFVMLSTPLNAWSRPYWATDNVGGRFIACRTGFYDPAVFQNDREVTFTGRIAGYETRTIGEYDYRLPRLDADVVYLWPVRERVDVITRPPPWPWWGWW